MIAVDTNVLVRFLVADDPDQSALARSLFASERVAVAHTVLLEAEWVLRRSFRFGRAEIAEAFGRLLGMATVSWVERDSVLAAVLAFEKGCDFADALHAATVEPGITAFMTFDQVFVAQAREIENFPPVRLLRARDWNTETA